MESILLLLGAFQTIFSDPLSLMFILIGVTAGIMVGCLPGLTATMGCALLIPYTFSMPPIQDILMLMGIFTGAIYGGSISGILIRTPGTPAAAATLIDGYPMSQKGEAGRAIGISSIASFIGGVIGALIMALLAPQIAQFGIRFGPPEFFALAIFGLTMIISISGESLLKGIKRGIEDDESPEIPPPQRNLPCLRDPESASARSLAAIAFGKLKLASKRQHVQSEQSFWDNWNENRSKKHKPSQPAVSAAEKLAALTIRLRLRGSPT